MFLHNLTQWQESRKKQLYFSEIIHATICKPMSLSFISAVNCNGWIIDYLFIYIVCGHVQKRGENNQF